MADVKFSSITPDQIKDAVNAGVMVAKVVAPFFKNDTVTKVIEFLEQLTKQPWLFDMIAMLLNKFSQTGNIAAPHEIAAMLPPAT